MPQDLGFTVPFPSRSNPAAPASRAHNLAWARRHGLLRSPRAERRYLYSQVAEFAAHAYPDAGADDLDLAFDLMGWFFLFDDQFDIPDPRHLREATAACQEHLLVVAHPDTPVRATRPTARAFADCWHRMCQGTSPLWQARTAHAWMDYFTAQLTEIADRNDEGHLDYDTHLARRRRTIGITPSLCLSERIDRLRVPDIAWHSTHLNGLRRAAIDQVIGVNEIFSLEKEEEHAAPNLVHDLMRLHGHTRQEAVHHVRDMADERMRQFVELHDRTPHWCVAQGLAPDETRAVTRYTELVAVWVRGNYDWHRTARRYTTTSTGRGPRHLGALTTEDLSAPRERRRPSTTLRPRT
ncbi:terpene synthase family protein (plasmid) [Streptomyces sp. BI20]|uniref:terpene synthase family protein n=1 Tax=Streptomyces sp. BI20 TaxID=3403460 RepID=UPI003C78DAB7